MYAKHFSMLFLFLIFFGNLSLIWKILIEKSRNYCNRDDILFVLIVAHFIFHHENSLTHVEHIYIYIVEFVNIILFFKFFWKLLTAGFESKNISQNICLTCKNFFYRNYVSSVLYLINDRYVF